VLEIGWCRISGFGLGEVTVDSIREPDVMYYCHKNKEKGKGEK